ncbi:MAG: addiction module protein [Planctomycetaceae bacterium]|nr:addiction module protein [Planctomycetaceae bacterium]
MTQATAQVFEAAMNLPRSERAELVNALWESVELELAGELPPRWKAEVRRRIEKIKSGEARLLTEAEFDKRLRDRYGSLAD